MYIQKFGFQYAQEKNEEHTSWMLEVSRKWNGCYFNCHFSIQHAIRPAQPLKETSTSWDKQLVSQTYKAANGTTTTAEWSRDETYR